MKTKKVTIGDATLYQGDCLDLIADVAPFDTLITDPPYSSGGAFRGDRAKASGDKYLGTRNGPAVDIDFYSDGMDARSWSRWSRTWLHECWQRLPGGAPAVVFTDWRQLPGLTDVFQMAGFIWRGVCPWVKPSHRCMSGRFSHAAEYFVWGSKGAMPIDFKAKTLPGAFTCSAPAPKVRLHQTEKPLALLAGIMPICKPGAVVLDPFMGAATTGVAALQSGRKFIGIELHPAYFDIACKRIEQTCRELDRHPF